MNVATLNSRSMAATDSAAGCSCRQNQLEGFLPFPSPMVMRELRSMGSSVSPAPSPRPVLSRLSMTIAISARAMVPFDTTSTPGARSLTGGGRSRFWNRCRKSIQRGIGVWGTSYAGGHVLVLGATDRRIRAVVSQVPTISGYEQGLRRVPPDAVAALEHQFDEDERAQLRGEPPRLQQVVNADPSVVASYRTADAIAFYLQPLPQGVWKNEVTVRSGWLARMYEPGQWVARVSPTPLLMIVALADNITLTDLQLRAYEQMLEPKKLATVEGGHFDPYAKQFPRASAAAVSWFRQHLAAGAPE